MSSSTLHNYGEYFVELVLILLGLHQENRNCFLASRRKRVSSAGTNSISIMLPQRSDFENITHHNMYRL